MEIIVLIALLWAWDGNLWEEVDPDPEPIVEELVVPNNAVDVTQVTQTAAVLTAVGQALSGTSTATQTEAQIIEELENMDDTTTTVPTTTTGTGTSTSTSTSTGT
jgi:hypothetical protein